jgi:hypothetical protein
MKKTLLILGILFTSSSFLKAQIPNQDFETWVGTEPNAWVTTNGLMTPPLNNPQTVFKSITAHSGLYACEMKAAKLTFKPSGVFIPDYVASIFIGKQIGIQSIRGFAYRNKPAQFEFWYTYNSTTNDSANAFVFLTKWNTSLMKTDTIAIGNFLNGANVSSFTKASINLNYLSSAEPDTAIILFSAITLSSQNAGSSFIIDDLAFTGGNVGINEITNKNGFTFYPNPSKDLISITFDNKQEILLTSIYDLNGKELFSESFDGQNQVKINIPKLTSGVYLLKVNETIKKLIIE